MENRKGYVYRIYSYRDADGENYIEIDAENKLSIACERTLIEPGKNYRLSIVMKNLSSDPLLLYSFWKSSIMESRNFTLAGENGNPATSETQKIHQP